MIINITEKLFLNLTSEWEQLFGKYNWYTFTFLELYFENDEFTGGLEFVATFLGFRLRARYNTDKYFEKEKEWLEDIDEVINTQQN